MPQAKDDPDKMSWTSLNSIPAPYAASHQQLSIALVNELHAWVAQCWPNGQRMARAAMRQPYVAHCWLAAHLLWRHLKRKRPEHASSLWEALALADPYAIHKLLQSQLHPHVPALPGPDEAHSSTFTQAQDCARVCLNRVSVRLIKPVRLNLAPNVYAALSTHSSHDFHGMAELSVLQVARVRAV